METATFGAGCFWGVEVAFARTKGVTHTAVGYMGGSMANPTYQDVCTGMTGHAEVCQVEFDPDVTSFETVLETFWECHDPTQYMRQGPDVGEQYRSVIFYHTKGQKEQSENAIENLNASKKYPAPVVTSVEPVATFWKAEEYHQKYFDKRNTHA